MTIGQLTAGVALGAIGVGAIAVQSAAAPMATLDSADFSYRWDFDAATEAGNYDLYDSTTGAATPDGTNEWNATPSPSAGAISLTNAAITNDFWVGSGIASTTLTPATGYTVEYRIRATPAVTTGNDGGLTVDAAEATNLAAVTLQYVDLDTNNDLAVYWDLGAIGTVYATVPDDEFVTLRIAGTPDVSAAGGVSYTLYVNDVEVADGLSRERAFASRRMLLGDVGGGARGTLEIDYVAFTSGAFAPVPEPGSLALALAGLTLIGLRRRG